MATKKQPTPNRPDQTQVAVIRSAFEHADAFDVTNDAQSLEAQLIIGKVKTAQAKLKEQRLGITRKIDAVKEAVMELFSPRDVEATLVIRVMGQKVLSYQKRQEEAAREAQRKLDVEAEKKRERDRKAAEKAQADGKSEKAQLLLERSEMHVAPVVQIAPTPHGGMTLVENFSFEISDVTKLKREYMMPDMVAIGRLVRALRDKKLAEDAVGTGSIVVKSSKDLRGRG